MTSKNTALNQAKLKELLHYDPNSGVFTWLEKRGNVNIGDIAGSISGRGYWYIQINYETHQAHRLAWLYHNGAWPSDQIDHINRNRTDNRIENLRCVSCKENNRNKSKNKRNSSGINGVHWWAYRGRWRATIKHNGKAKYIGCFVDINDAAEARRLAEIKYGYHENHGK